ncbi:glycosyltransferase [[Eubacterium] tenue]|nr:glycosyltransferase [[Eubacterium] tenue]MBC8632136.1 glycosyltransferase [[Eubacterium] tenue]
MLNLYKRDFLIQNNLFFCEGIIGEDELHCFQTFLLAKRVLYIPKKLYFRRIRNDSIMTSADYKKRFESTEVVIREMCEFYLNNKDLFKLDTLASMKNYIKFIFNIALVFCDRGNLIDDKKRIIETFNIDEIIFQKDLTIKGKTSDEEYNKKNILFVMYLLLDGGAEKALMAILDNLDYSKYNLDLIVLAKEKSYLHNINENVNVSYMYDTTDEMHREYANGNFNLELEKEYDIEIGFLGIFTTWVICRFGSPNAKKITWLHGDFSLMVCGNSKDYVSDIYGRMDKIISVSDGVSKSFSDFLGDSLNSKLQRIYVPVDTSKIRKLSLEEIEYKKSKFTIMSIGRLSSEKGFDRLIKVHKKLIDEGIENELIILGNGGEEANLKRLVKDLGLSDSCKFMDYQKNPYPWIKMCDVFVSSSYAEALGLAIIEAMVLEKPIVATDNHGSRALFKDKLGLMVSNSEDGLYYGLRLMILNKDIRDLYTKNLKEVEKFDFDKSIVMPEIEKLFDGGKE